MPPKSRKKKEATPTAEEMNRPFESWPTVGSLCSVCFSQQRQTPGGLSCENGHGGAEPLDVVVPRALTGTTCSDCGSPQVFGDDGPTCKFGHHGAASLEETRARPGFNMHAPPPAIPESERVARGLTGVPTKGVVLHWSPEERARYEEKHPKPAALPYDFTVDQSGTVRDAVTGDVLNLPTTKSGAAVSFVHVKSRELIEVVDPEAVLAGPRIDGAIVKLAPTVRASERESFDGIGIKARLYAHGASAVVLAPRIVADTGVTKEARAQAARVAMVAPEQAVREFFAGMHGLAPDEVEEAVQLALQIVEGC
jgi:hypothetical protein